MQAGGFKLVGALLVRVDILERVAGRLKLLAINGPFEIGPQILNLLGCSAKQAVSIVFSLGYIQKKFETESQEIIVPLFINAKHDHPNLKKRKKSKVFNSKNRNRLHADLLIEESPFAKLKEISIR